MVVMDRFDMVEAPSIVQGGRLLCYIWPPQSPKGEVYCVILIVFYLAPSIPQGGRLLCYIDCVLFSIQLIQLI